jgi:hypothetical protein
MMKKLPLFNVPQQPKNEFLMRRIFTKSMFHFIVPQHVTNCKTFESKDRTFQVYEFRGENSKAGMYGRTEGVLVNQIQPVKKTALFSRYYYSEGSGAHNICHVAKEFLSEVEELSRQGEFSLYGDPEVMLEKADGRYFKLAINSSKFISLADE